MHDLEITWPAGQARFSPTDSPIEIGRSPDAAIVLSEPSVSRQHIEFVWTGTAWTAADSSTHGSFDPIGVRLAPSWTVGTNTTIRLGGVEGVELRIELVTTRTEGFDPSLGSPPPPVEVDVPPAPPGLDNLGAPPAVEQPAGFGAAAQPFDAPAPAGGSQPPSAFDAPPPGLPDPPAAFDAPPPLAPDVPAFDAPPAPAFDAPAPPAPDVPGFDAPPAPAFEPPPAPDAPDLAPPPGFDAAPPGLPDPPPGFAAPPPSTPDVPAFDAPPAPAFDPPPAPDAPDLAPPPGFDAPDLQAPSAFDAPGLPDAPDLPTPGAFDAPRLPDAPDLPTPSAFDAPQLPDAPDLPTPGAFDAPQLPDAPDLPAPSAFDAPGLPDAPAPGAFDAPRLPDAPAPAAFDAPQLPDAPAPGAFDAPQLPDAPAPGAFDAPRLPDAPAPGAFDAPPIAPFDAPSQPEAQGALGFDAPGSAHTGAIPELASTTAISDSTIQLSVDGKDYTFLPGTEVTIGRDPSCLVTVDERHSLVSRRHLKVTHRDDHWWMEDFSSKGTFIDGRQITGPYKAEGAFMAQLGDDDAGTPLRVITAGEHRAPRKQGIGLLIAIGLLALLAIAALAIALTRGDDPVTDTSGAPVVETGETTVVDLEEIDAAADDLAAAKQATVLLLTEEGLGSGFFVTDRLIVTNQHVAVLAPSLVVAVSRQQDTPAIPEYEATTVALHPFLDIAVLEIATDLDGNAVDSSGLQAATVGDSDSLTLGDAVYNTGFPANISLISRDDMGQVQLPPVGTTSGEAASFSIWPGCSNPDFESFIPIGSPDSVTCAPDGDVPRGIVITTFSSGQGASGSPVFAGNEVVAVVYAGPLDEANAGRNITTASFKPWLDGVISANP